MTRWIVLLCRLAVGGIFIYASLDKLAHPGAFAAAIDNYRMVPYSLLHPMAHLLPVLEMVMGLGLVLGVLRRGAALIAALLTLVFIVAIASALARGLDISCGCFNTDGGHGVGLDLLVRDVVLLLLCLPPLLKRDGGPELADLLKK
ncbi:MAG: MauE/DoxX family redox-associated membrane protein [Candidatus Krumholzibacteriia bacterium]